MKCEEWVELKKRVRGLDRDSELQPRSWTKRELQTCHVLALVGIGEELHRITHLMEDAIPEEEPEPWKDEDG